MVADTLWRHLGILYAIVLTLFEHMCTRTYYNAAIIIIEVL